MSTILYSPSTGAFYDTAFNSPAQIPGDVKQISHETHAELINAQGDGYQIVPGEDGLPTLQAPKPPSEAELRRRALFERDGYLRTATLRMEPLQDAIDLGEATKAEKDAMVEWKRYRLALNRIEQVEGFPTDFEWPQPPQA
ncbi:tail fiber assembly protein [Bordetella sp. 02P26C-1]|uniref:tail fiber assembly protein n=1 Tax=Bordetella sp. 02P26C-1 TaxID=2683195 RepID=UPI00135375D3|nr:tail fiber assembly protein [Bordetella sp. 02P26C-1]MVW80165.1 phage tail protein [Bordetella sp. 02P26C-1]